MRYSHPCIKKYSTCFVNVFSAPKLLGQYLASALFHNPLLFLVGNVQTNYKKLRSPTLCYPLIFRKSILGTECSQMSVQGFISQRRHLALSLTIPCKKKYIFCNRIASHGNETQKGQQQQAQQQCSNKAEPPLQPSQMFPLYWGKKHCCNQINK